MSVRIKMRYDTLAAWNSTNPNLLEGEFAVAKDGDSIIVKVGTDEGTTWATAPQISGTGTPIEGLDFTDLQAGEVLFWDGTTWYGRGLDELISGGNKISVSRNNDGTINIAYFDTTFVTNNPTISSIVNTTGTFTTATQEVGTAWSGELGFSITLNDGASSVDEKQGNNGTISHSPTRLSGWSNRTFNFTNNTGTTGNITELSITSSAFSSWFTVGTQSLSFTASGIQSLTVDEAGNTIPAATANNTSISKSYAWRFWGFSSEAELSLNDIATTHAVDPTDNALYNAGTSGTLHTLISNLSTQNIISWDFDVNAVDTEVNSASTRYIYFAVSTASGSTSNYGFTPIFYPDLIGLNVESGFENLGQLQYVSGTSTYHYSIYRLNIQQTSDVNGRVNFRVSS
jgi:hypothetical protein